MEYYEISYEKYCMFGALRNRLLFRRWCQQCKKDHYYAREGELYYPQGPESSPGEKVRYTSS